MRAFTTEGFSQRTLFGLKILKNFNANKPGMFIALSGAFRSLKFPAYTNVRYSDTYDRARTIWKYLRSIAMFSKRTVIHVIYDSETNR